MKFERLIETMGDRPLIDTVELAHELRNPATLHSQLSRWVSEGRLVRVRRGLYALASPYDRISPHPLHVATALQDSYVSGESALHFHGVIPKPLDLMLPEGLGCWPDDSPSSEGTSHRRVHLNPWRDHTPSRLRAIRCCTSGRPRVRHTPLGDYDYRHLGTQVYGGFEVHEVTPGQTANIATPEKALLDLVYLQAGGANARYLGNLPSIEWKRIDTQLFSEMATQTGVGRLSRAARMVDRIIRPTRVVQLTEC